MKHLEFNSNQLWNFRQNAIAHCYLGEFKKSETIERPGFFEMNYFEGDFTYRDSFTGFYVSTGQEIIRYKDIPVWSCNYGGGVIKEYFGNLEFFKQLESFLRKALAKADSNGFFPRGPENFIENDFDYKCNWQGNVDKFDGLEEIFYKGKKVFYHHFFGGQIIGKDVPSQLEKVKAEGV